MAKKEEPAKEKVKEKAEEAQKKEAPKPKEAKKEKIPEKEQKKERRGAPKEVKKEAPKPKEGQPEIKHIVRIADTDLDGKRSVQYALTGIKGISRRVAKVLAANAGLNPTATLGYLNDADIEKLQSSVNDIVTIVPSWMMNKQNDLMTGEDRHVIGMDVLLSLNEDLNMMKKIRSYKGIRHERGLKVRGQRTRATGRKGRTVGVTRAAIAATKAKEGEKGEKKEEKKGGT